jgi:hypothetical protein
MAGQVEPVETARREIVAPEDSLVEVAHPEPFLVIKESVLHAVPDGEASYDVAVSVEDNRVGRVADVSTLDEDGSPI